MPATMKGAISFGLLHVPISLHTATQDNDIHFNQLCREDGSRVKYKKVCANCSKGRVNSSFRRTVRLQTNQVKALARDSSF